MVSTRCKCAQTRQAAPKKEPQSGEIFVENAWLVNFGGAEHRNIKWL